MFFFSHFMHFSGVISNASESNFAYNAPRSSWRAFLDLNFRPMFKTLFTDSLLEQKAKMVCGDDAPCLFDVAATGNVEIGTSTRKGMEELERIIQLTRPSEEIQHNVHPTLIFFT